MKPEDMSLQQLRDEVAYWRAEARASLHFALTDARMAADKGDHERAEDIIRDRLRQSAGSLESALNGEIHMLCEACGKPLRDGQLTIASDDTNDVHAECMGATPENLATGGIWVDPQSIVTWDGEPPALNAEGKARLPILPFDAGLGTIGDMRSLIGEARRWAETYQAQRDAAAEAAAERHPNHVKFSLPEPWWRRLAATFTRSAKGESR